MMAFPAPWMADLPSHVRIRVENAAGLVFADTTAATTQLMSRNGQAFGGRYLTDAHVNLSLPRPWTRHEWRLWFWLVDLAAYYGARASMADAQ